MQFLVWTEVNDKRKWRMGIRNSSLDNDYKILGIMRTWTSAPPLPHLKNIFQISSNFVHFHRSGPLFITIHDISLVYFIWGTNFIYKNVFLHLSFIHPYVRDGRKQHVGEWENWNGFRWNRGWLREAKHTGEGLNRRDLKGETGWLNISETLAKCRRGVNSLWPTSPVPETVKRSPNSCRSTLCL